MTAPTNKYYQRNFDATGGQLARSRQMVKEFVLIQRGFDLIGDFTGSIKYQLSCSDLVSELVEGPAKAYLRTTGAFRLTEVRASVLQASVLGPVRISIMINGSQGLFIPLQIDEGDKTSVSSSVPAVIAYQDLPDDSEVVFDLINAGTDARGLIVTLLGTNTEVREEP